MTARVLIVADRFDRAKHLERVLVAASYEVAIATREDDAFAFVRLSLCDVVLLDADWPGLEPFALCRALKAGFVPVMMITDKTKPWQRLLALDAGADECLSGPFPDDTLLGRVRSLAACKGLADEIRRSAALRGVPGSMPAASHPARVLLLDPDARSRERLQSVLATEFSVDAGAAPERWIGSAARGAFQVAVVSHEWPEVDGMRYARQLRLADQTGLLRIVLLTDDEDLPLRTWEGVADDCLTRPVDRNEALARTRLASRKHHLAAALEQLAAPLPLPAPQISPLNLRRPPERFAA
jgi:DNA-binding response OmpR family regulator